MRRIPTRLLPALLAAGLILPLAAAACSSGSDDKDRRVVDVVQTDDACTPASINAALGEKLKLQVQNTGKKDHEIEGTEGTKLEELLVPAGKTRSVNFTAPNKPGVQKFKCYIPNGSTTIIQVNVGGAPGAPAATPAR